MAQESLITTINNLAQSCLDNFEDMDITEQLDFTRDVLQQIKNICYKLSTKRYYIRVCSDGQDLDLSVLQLYSFEELKEEYVAIDYVDEDEAQDLTIEDLKEIARNNLEVVQEIEVIQYL